MGTRNRRPFALAAVLSRPNRTLARAWRLGAHLAALRRTASGALTLAGAHTLDELAALSEAERDALLLPADTLLADWPEVRLDDADAGRFLSGLRRRLDLADAPRVRVYGPSSATLAAGRERRAFLGSAHIQASELIPTRLLSPLEVQGLLDAPASNQAPA